MNTAPVGQTPLAAEPSKDGERKQIAKLAHEFESMLMTQMLREMRRSMLSDEGEGGYGNAAMTDTVDIELGQALTRAGGFGLTASLTSSLTSSLTTFPAQTRALPAALPAATPQTAPLASPEPSVPPSTEPLSVGVPGGRVTSAFGWRRDPLTGAARFHKGIDVAQPVGQNVAAAAAGRVIESGDRGGYGTTIVIDHGGGRQTRYAHLSETAVRIGDSVDPGQLIGKTGNSGRSTGPHLHFEVTQDGRPVDPSNH